MVDRGHQLGLDQESASHRRGFGALRRDLFDRRLPAQLSVGARQHHTAAAPPDLTADVEVRQRRADTILDRRHFANSSVPTCSLKSSASRSASAPSSPANSSVSTCSLKSSASRSASAPSSPANSSVSTYSRKCAASRSASAPSSSETGAK